MSSFDIIIEFSKLDAAERAEIAENISTAKQVWPEARKADIKKLEDLLDLMKRTAV